MRFSMLYSGEQILSFKSCLVFYAGDSLMLIFCFTIGNICNGRLLGNASIARGLTCCKKLARHEASRKSWSTKFPLGGKAYLASGLIGSRPGELSINQISISREIATGHPLCLLENRARKLAKSWGKYNKTSPFICFKTNFFYSSLFLSMAKKKKKKKKKKRK